MSRIVVYDFDKTLTSDDTLFGFFRHAAPKGVLYGPKLLLYIAAMAAAKWGIVENTRLKAWGVRLFLYGMEEERYLERSRSYARRIRCNDLCIRLRHEEEPEESLVVTASFVPYVSACMQEKMPVIGSDVQIEKGRVVALAYNCYGEEKARRLRAQGIERIARLYTDSYSDAALAKMAEEIYVVSDGHIEACPDFEAFRRYFGR